MMRAKELLSSEFSNITDVIRAHACENGDKAALIAPLRTVSYREFDSLIDRVAAALQRDGVAPAEMVAICATLTTVEYAVTFFGILRAGAIVAPLAPSSTPDILAMQLRDCAARVLFLDRDLADHMGGKLSEIAIERVALDGSKAGAPFESWLAGPGAIPTSVEIDPRQGFNIIYSSGTTGAPKGIVQPHAMRWGQIRRGLYSADAVTMVTTPLYSNTTLMAFLPTIAHGGTAVLMPKFDITSFLALSQAHRATHAMLVPVQYRRLMDSPAFDDYDLSSYVMKYSTSAPFAAELKREILRRWPGGLSEGYGMTEGGGTCRLECHEFSDKLHTVGRPMPGHDIRLIDEAGREVAPGEIGEIVGRSPTMMVGYHNQPEKTRDAEWYSPEGLRFIRTGDIGRFDADGFLVLMDRKKDMIISGGFNIYPTDLEAEVNKHPAVAESAVVGVASETWGETPVAFVVLKAGSTVTGQDIKAFANAHLGKTQRLFDVVVVDALSRSHIGKILKRELRDSYRAAGQIPSGAPLPAQ